MNMVVEKMTETLKLSLSNYTQHLQDRIASLEKQVLEKDKVIAHLQVRHDVQFCEHLISFQFHKCVHRLCAVCACVCVCVLCVCVCGVRM